jgi:uncharacterized protein (TIGR00255 family)
MALRSMTGFARFDGSIAGTRFHWELRSVNGRGLDVRLRLPPGYEAIEAQAREAVSRHVARGNVALTLSIDQGATSSEVRINERALETVSAAAEQLRLRHGWDNVRPEGVLALRGVLEVGEGPSVNVEAAQPVLLAGLETALGALGVAREGEGARLEAVMRASIECIGDLVARITALPSRTPEAIRARLSEQVQRLAGTGVTFEPERLHQEAILIATRADIEEEIKRLGAHIAAAQALVGETAPAGRRLDFLAQEFNREANTICSKSGDVEMTRLGLELKAVIDQLREQVQNIE